MRRCDVIDLVAEPGECAMKRSPFAARRGWEYIAARSPTFGIHPRIDLVSHPEMIGRTHQVSRFGRHDSPSSSRRTARLPPFHITNHVLEAVERRAEVLAGNDQRWREANDGAVRFLREHALGQQAFADFTRAGKARINLDAAPHPTTTMAIATPTPISSQGVASDNRNPRTGHFSCFLKQPTLLRTCGFFIWAADTGPRKRSASTSDVPVPQFVKKLPFCNKFRCNHEPVGRSQQSVQGCSKT
jgi:hypothetical protein